MNVSESPMESLLPEIYPIIASHLPLHSTPSTLLYLALTSRCIYNTVLPILHSRLILKNERDAISILKKLTENPSFGHAVRELHIMSDLSFETQQEGPAADVINVVQDVILNGHLPFIHTLGLHLMTRWYFDEKYNPTKGFGRVRKEFWAELRERCPRLQSLTLRGFEDDSDNLWMEASGYAQVSDLTSLDLHVVGFYMPQSFFDKRFDHVSSLAHSLHSLKLEMDGGDSTLLSSIFQLDFPVLQSLSFALHATRDARESTAFFARHPSIVFLNLGWHLDTDDPWFITELPDSFLPNLRYLRARWKDVRCITPILLQLTGLTIFDSVNAQIPYLLRQVIPNGLSNLRSFAFGQRAFQSYEGKQEEASCWYEDEDGVFHQAKRRYEPRTIFDGYMHSIVRGGPNLEEIAFINSFGLDTALAIADDLANFSNLKRLYYKESYGNFDAVSTEQRTTFAEQSEALIRAVPKLESVTNVFTSCLPYLTARTQRNDRGEVVGVEVGKGFGMMIGYEDEAFPWAPGPY